MLSAREWKWLRFLGTATAALCLVFMASADEGNRRGDDGDNGDDPAFFDSSGESVGTLPSANGSPCEPWCYRPSLLIEASRADFEAAFLGFDGDLYGVGVAFQESGKHRYSFYGPSFKVQLDRGLIDVGAVEVLVQIGPAFAEGAYGLATSGSFSGFQPLPVGFDFDPGFGALLASGAVEIAPVTAHLVNRRRAHSMIEMSAFANVVEFEQTHVLFGR